MTANRWELVLLIGLAGKKYQNCHVKENVDSTGLQPNCSDIPFFWTKSQVYFGGDIFLLCSSHVIEQMSVTGTHRTPQGCYRAALSLCCLGGLRCSFVKFPVS